MRLGSFVSLLLLMCPVPKMMPVSPWEKVLASWGKGYCCLRPFGHLEMFTLTGDLMTWTSFFTSISSSASLSLIGCSFHSLPHLSPHLKHPGTPLTFPVMWICSGKLSSIALNLARNRRKRSCLYWGGEKGDRLVILQELSLFGDNMEGCMADKKYLANVIAFHFCSSVCLLRKTNSLGA